MSAIRAVDDQVRIAVRAQPGAKRSEVTGIVTGQVRIRLAAPAVDGKANAELIRFLSRQLRVRPSAITIHRGVTDRNKTIDVTGITVNDCISALSAN